MGVMDVIKYNEGRMSSHGNIQVKSLEHGRSW